MPAVTVPPRIPLDLVLHIGSDKTGTSSIQAFLDRNRRRLAELGYLYPKTPGRTRHVRLGLSIRPDGALDGFITWHRQGAASPEQFRKSFRRRLLREIDKSGLSRVVFSDEALYNAPSEALRRLCEFVDEIARSLRVVVYLRRQDDHMVSRYQQAVKVGATKRLTEWMGGRNAATFYDYYRRLRTWERLLEPDEFVVRRFERDSFVGGSLVQDFLDAAAIDARAEELEQTTIHNISLDVESLEFLRIFNIHRVENEGARAGLIDNRTFVAQLAEHSTGPILTLPSDVLDEFMARWAETNRAVARRYLRDTDGELFRTPRRTDNVGTDQFLDPDRLAHFLGLVDLPEQLHAPLRRVAEREAKNR